jgi:pilus assembly protein FimV
MKRKLNRLLIASALFAPVGAFALGMGQIQIRSALNQPLNAQIELTAAAGYEYEKLSARLASAQAFAQSGLDRPGFLSDLQFSIQPRPDGGAFIQVTSRRPIREPIVNFLLELEWPQGRLVREFAVFLDPSPTGIAPPVQPVAALPPAAPVARPRAAPPTEPPATRPTPPRRPPPAPLQTNVPLGTDTYRVPRGDTLWGIAQRLRPHPAVSPQRMMEALFLANPGAFSQSNMDRLLAGAVLRVPSIQEIDPRIDPSQVIARTPAPPPSAAPSQPLPVPETEPQVRLVPPEGEPAAPAEATAPAAAATMDPGLAIQLDQGRLKLKVAGLDDIRRRVSSLAQVDNAALSALQQGGQRPETPAEPTAAAEPAEQPPAEQTAAPPPALEPATPPALEPAPPPQTFQEVTPAPIETPPAAAPGAEAPVEPPPAIEEAAPPSLTTPQGEETAAPGPGTETPAPPAAETTPPAETPAPAPQATTTPAGETPAAEQGFLSALLSHPLLRNPFTWALGGFVALLLIALPILLRRRHPEEGEEENPFATAERQPSARKQEPPFEPVSELPKAPREPASTPGSDDTLTKPMPLQPAPAPRAVANPLERVELLTAVGNYAEAENTVRSALRDNPGDVMLTGKLLDIYYATKNREAFLREAQALHDKFEDKAGTLWNRIARMGRELAPGHALFTAVSQAVPVTRAVELSKEALSARPPQGGATPLGGLDFDVPERASLAEDTRPPKEPATSALDNLDWQLPDMEPPTGKTATPPGGGGPPGKAAAAKTSLQDDFEAQLQNVDFDFEPVTQIAPEDGREHGTGFPATEMPKTEMPKTELPNLDFALGEETAPAAKQGDSPISAMSAATEDYVETKLDLAVAYLEMGDAVGARTLLEEVLQEGSITQKKRAEDFITKLP